MRSGFTSSTALVALWAHGVGDDRRVALRHANVEVRMLPVAVIAISIRRTPIVVGEVGLGEGDEHAHIVGGAQDLREAQVRPWLAAIVVGIDEVDAQALEPLQGLPRPA